MKGKLVGVDNIIYNFLKINVDNMPHRLLKLVAFNYTDPYIRKLYLSRLGVDMGEGSLANLGLEIVRNNNEICVKIGKNVSIAPNVTLITESRANNGKEINELFYVREMLTKVGNILIEDEVWIGANVTIMPGVTIGKCAVIGAGSVVLTDVEEYSIYAGTPAKKIRNLKTGDRVNTKD